MKYLSIDHPPTFVAFAGILNFIKTKFNFSLGVNTTELARQENQSTRLRYKINGWVSHNAQQHVCKVTTCLLMPINQCSSRPLTGKKIISANHFHVQRDTFTKVTELSTGAVKKKAHIQ